MRRITPLLAAVAVVALLVLIALPWWSGRSAPVASGLPEPTATDGRGAVAAVDVPLPTVAERESIGGADGRESRDAQALGTWFRGRCVDVNGDGVADCAIEVRFGSKRAHLGVGTDARADPAPAHSVRSGADGTFGVFVPLATSAAVVLDVRHADAIGRRTAWSELGPGYDLDLGRIVVRRGCRARGRVVDTGGAALDGVIVRLQRVFSAGSDRRGLRQRSDYVVVSGVDGALAIDEPLAAGEWRVTPVDRLAARETILTIVDGQLDAAFDVVVVGADEIDAISGRVVDPFGVPVVAAVVDLEPPTAGRVRTDERGRFQVPRGPDDEPGPFRVVISKDGWERERTAPHDWGAHDVRVVLRRGVDAELRVVDARTGRAVDRFAWAIAAADEARRGVDRLAETGAHVDGRVVWDGLARGPKHVAVVPDDPRFVPMLWTNVVVDDGSRSVELELPRRRPLRVRVVDADGRPCVGSVVEIVVPDGELPSARGGGARTVPAVDGLRALFSRGRRALRVDRATTDARGDATLDGPEGVPIVVQALGPDHVPQVRAAVRVEDHDLFELRVSRGARVTGRLASAAGWLHDARVTLCADDGRIVPSAAGVPVGPDGAFAVAGVPAGDWTVRLHYRDRGDRGASTSVDLERIESVSAGESRRIVHDLAALEPGTVHARVFWDGAAVHGFGRVERAGDDLGNDEPEPVGGFERIDAGRIELVGRPGRYRLAVLATTPTGRVRLVSDPFERFAGRITAVVLTVRPRDEDR